MDFTGERFIPNAGLDGELEIEHYQRYRALSDLISGKTILDAASGEGYGSDILALDARHVYGLEIDPQAVNQARQKYCRSNLTYVQGSIANLPFSHAAFDIAVSFETIEHVTSNLQESFLHEIKRVLKPNGLFIVSTPDKKIYSDQAHYHNEFHVKEFYREEFHSFLANRFKYVSFWEQTAMLGYFLTNGQKGSVHKLMEPSEVEGKYIIALCSDAPLPDVQFGSLALDTEDRFRRSVQRVIELQDEIEEKNKHIHIVLRDIEICETTIRQLEETLKENALHAEESIQALNIELEKHCQRVAKLENTLAETSGRLQHMETTKAWRLINALYRFKDLCLGRR